MFKHLLSITLLTTACGTVEAPGSVEPISPVEPTCPAGQTCSCTAGAFLGCDGDSARTCNAGGNGTETDACGAPGCNATAGRCNSCEPDSVSCSADARELEHCGADGLPELSEACIAGCVDGKDGKPAHCAHLEPMFLPDVCDVPATMAAFALSSDATIDTSLDAICTGGIVTQASGPEICVIRYGTIEIATRLTVRGSRAVALVADHDLLMKGTLDVSADGAANGPGGGAVISGARAVSAVGGGGAGFGSNGADGGSADPAGGGGGLAGAALDPLVPLRFVGGGRPLLPTFQQANYPVSGGGGGALMLISCRGSVSVTGTIDAGGGGGGGGRDADLSTGTQYTGGAGGGAGGYVALQGIEVRISGGGVFANGGAGGGGCSVNGCVGTPGGDGVPSTKIAQGGAPKDQGGTGGNGGTGQLPTKGLASYYSPGGGGGAAGRLQVFKPTNGTVSISTTTSPAFEADRTIQLR